MNIVIQNLPVIVLGFVVLVWLLRRKHSPVDWGEVKARLMEKQEIGEAFVKGKKRKR